MNFKVQKRKGMIGAQLSRLFIKFVSQMHIARDRAYPRITTGRTLSTQTITEHY